MPCCTNLFFHFFVVKSWPWKDLSFSLTYSLFVTDPCTVEPFFILLMFRAVLNFNSAISAMQTALNNTDKRDLTVLFERLLILWWQNPNHTLWLILKTIIMRKFDVGPAYITSVLKKALCNNGTYSSENEDKLLDRTSHQKLLTPEYTKSSVNKHKEASTWWTQSISRKHVCHFQRLLARIDLLDIYGWWQKGIGTALNHFRFANLCACCVCVCVTRGLILHEWLTLG